MSRKNPEKFRSMRAVKISEGKDGDRFYPTTTHELPDPDIFREPTDEEVANLVQRLIRRTDELGRVTPTRDATE